MGDYIKEIRDPVHVFIRIDETERAIIDSHPFQRLRNIHQLAMTYLVYPGATHRRFEHSLGVMELAGRIYDIITNPDNIIDDTIHSFVPRRGADWHHGYWRSVLRIAALCHDLGHLPFSHGAEDLMPPGWNHERLTLEIIFNSEITSILKEAGHDVDKKENAAPVFPVLLRDGTIESSINQSELLKRIPPLIVDNIFVHPSHVKEVETWLRREKDNIIGGTT